MRQAGVILLGYFNKNIQKYYKHGHELVTEADYVVERYLIQELTLLIPESGIIAEESEPRKSAEWNWVIDPIDGTVNFAHQIPYFCISVTLTQYDRPVIGMIYNPLLKELFYAIQDGGAYVNDHKISVSQTATLSQAFVSTVLARGIQTLSFWEKMGCRTRHFGAYALDLAYVACGRLDCVMPINFSWWDVAAGVLLIQEAGGCATDMFGKHITPQSRLLIASNRILHKTLIDHASQAEFI